MVMGRVGIASATLGEQKALKWEDKKVGVSEERMRIAAKKKKRSTGWTLESP